MPPILEIKINQRRVKKILCYKRGAHATDPRNRNQLMFRREGTGKGHRAHTDPLFSALNILKFEDLFRYNCSCLIHKFFLNRLPDSFKNKYLPFFIPNRTNSLQVSKPKNDFLKQLPAYFLPLVWNKNSPESKLLESHTTFKKSIYEEFISNYPPAHLGLERS